jgi:hypothetical protein
MVKIDRCSSEIPSAVFQETHKVNLDLPVKGLYVGIDHRRVERISYRTGPLAPLGKPMLSF